MENASSLQSFFLSLEVFFAKYKSWFFLFVFFFFFITILLVILYGVLRSQQEDYSINTLIAISDRDARDNKSALDKFQYVFNKSSGIYKVISGNEVVRFLEENGKKLEADNVQNIISRYSKSIYLIDNKKDGYFINTGLDVILSYNKYQECIAISDKNCINYLNVITDFAETPKTMIERVNLIKATL